MAITEAAYNALRESAKRVKPDEYLKPTRYWVGVLFEGIDPASVSDTTEFLWIKANAKTTIEAVHNEYKKRKPGQSQLYLGSTQAVPTDQLKSLNVYDDRLIILLAVPESARTSSSTAPVIGSDAVRSPPRPVKREPGASPVVGACDGARGISTAPPCPSIQGLREPGVKREPGTFPAVDVGRGDVRSIPTSSHQPAPVLKEPAAATSAWLPPVVDGRDLTRSSASPASLLQHQQPFPPSGWSSPSYTPQASPTMGYLGSTAPPTQFPRAYQPPNPYDPRPADTSLSALLAREQQLHLWGQSHTGQSSQGTAMQSQSTHLHSQAQPIYGDALAHGTAQKARPPSWQASICEVCRRSFTVMPDSKTGPKGGILCFSCGDRLQSDRAIPAPMHQEGSAAAADTQVSPAPTTDSEPEPQNPFLQQLASETVPEKLEKGVEKAMELLEKLETSFKGHEAASQDTTHWLQSMDALKKQVVRNRTVIGVVGNTGAGKSSVINALLDEERLVPTNCMRACTAVVTELSWNDSDDEASRYRADVEFIKVEDWHKELRHLFSDLTDGSGNFVKECSNPDSEAGIAFAKIRAVYPNKAKEQIVADGIDMLMRDPAVQNVLGTTKEIRQSDPNKFHERLQSYVDSQEKTTGRPKKDEIKRMEFWPLIKVVKIYTKAEALSTGAVVVDLPGVQDSNAARAAVADGYMKQCTGLWIVAPITRAVDDKAAKTLLGDTFKRQLKLDGTYGNVTFICSKTDDISLQEAVYSLELDGIAQKLWEELDQRRGEIEDLKEQLKGHQQSGSVYTEIVDSCDDELEVWEKLDKKARGGETVYPPAEKSKKRKKQSKSGSKKKRRTDDSDDDFIDDDSEASEVSETSDTEDKPEDQEPLTKETIDTKIDELRLKKKEAKEEKSKIEKQMKALRKQMKELRAQATAVDNEVSAMCIKGRNEYSKGAIQQDFAAGVKDLDQEAAIEEDEEHFDPDVDLRDYDEVARSLPVFCVSSRGYQKLCGRLEKDKVAHGFQDIYDTEMPQLQAHCKKLTEAGRAANSRKFLNNLSQLLTSMSMWTSSHGNGLPMSAGQKRREAQFLEQKLVELLRSLNKVVDDTLSEITNSLTQEIYDKYERAVRNASEASLPTTEKWGRRRDEGGLHFCTYRATVRRNGIFTGASGPQDFNGELAEPMIKQIATGWERAFRRNLPAHMKTFTEKTLAHIQEFHKTVIKRANDNGASIAGVQALGRQLQNYEPFLKDQVRTIEEMMTTIQREVNREFTPVIAASMDLAYQRCAAEAGTGMFTRMKNHMSSHVERNRDKMFQEACDAVKARLDGLAGNIKLELATRSNGIYSTARRDYSMVLGHLGATDTPPSQVELTIRDEVSLILEDGEDVFRRLVEGEDDEGRNGVDDANQMNIDNEARDQTEHTADQMIVDDETASPIELAPVGENNEKSTDKKTSSSEEPDQWGSEDTLVGFEKENSGIFADKIDSIKPKVETATAEDAVLTPLDGNVQPNF